MKYELKYWEKGMSELVAKVERTIITMTSGPVGDTYGFTRTDTMFVDVPDVKTIEQADAIFEQAAEDFIAEKYPNT